MASVYDYVRFSDTMYGVPTVNADLGIYESYLLCEILNY